MMNYLGANTIINAGILCRISLHKQLEFYVELDTTLIRKLL